MTNLKSVTLLAMVMLCAIGSSVRGDLILNPSFETPELNNSSQHQFFTPGNTIGQGWFVESGDSGASVIPNEHGFIFPPATDGDQKLYLGEDLGSTTVSQEIVLAANTSYLLQFDLASFDRNIGAGALLRLDIHQNGVSILPAVAEFTEPIFGGFQTQQYSFTTNVNGTYKLFISTEAGYGTIVDNFKLAAVPEPSSVLAISVFTGLAGVIARRRSRANRVQTC